MPLVHLIRVSMLFCESNLLDIEGINDPKCLGKKLGKFRGFRDETGDEKWRCPSVSHWGAAPGRSL